MGFPFKTVQRWSEAGWQCFFVGRTGFRAAANANHTEGFKHKNQPQIPTLILQHPSKAQQKFGGCAEPYPPYALSHLKREAVLFNKSPMPLSKKH